MELLPLYQDCRRGYLVTPASGQNQKLVQWPLALFERAMKRSTVLAVVAAAAFTRRRGQRLHCLGRTAHPPDARQVYQPMPPISTRRPAAVCPKRTPLSVLLALSRVRADRLRVEKPTSRLRITARISPLVRVGRSPSQAAVDTHFSGGALLICRRIVAFGLSGATCCWRLTRPIATPDIQSVAATGKTGEMVFFFRTARCRYSNHYRT